MKDISSGRIDPQGLTPNLMISPSHREPVWPAMLNDSGVVGQLLLLFWLLSLFLLLVVVVAAVLGNFNCRFRRRCQIL